MVRIVIVMKTGFVLGKDEVWLEANDIVQESAELVNFTTDDNIGSGVLLEVAFMRRNALFEVISLLCNSIDLVSKLKDCKEVSLVSQCLLTGNSFFQVIDKSLQAAQSFLSEILGRRCVLLNALKVFDREECLFTLFVDNLSQSAVLL